MLLKTNNKWTYLLWKKKYITIVDDKSCCLIGIQIVFKPE